MTVVNNIYPRLFIPFTLTLLLVALAAWWIATALLARGLEQRLSGQLDHATAVLAQGSLPFTDDLLGRLAQLLRADVILIGADGHGMVTTLSSNAEALHQAVADRAAEWRQSSFAPAQVEFQHEGTPYLLMLRPLQAGRDTRYAAVGAFTDLSTVRQISHQTAWWLGATTALGVLGVAAVGHRIASAITGPIRELATMANRITGGDRAVRVRVHGPAEVSCLATALNTMAERLEIYEQELVQASRLAAVGQMSTRIAHEIRNPLTAIKMQVQLLDDSLGSEYHATTTALLTEIRRLELIVANTLQQSRFSKPIQKFAVLNTLITDITQLMKAQFTHRGIDLETVLEPALPKLMLDVDQIKQVLLNLLVNAADALSAGGRIRVTTSHTANPCTVALSVEDSGPGIPAERRAHLFTAAASDKPNGFGLGLRLSKELVELHGGRIELGDSALGGACFRIIFPIED